MEMIEKLSLAGIVPVIKVEDAADAVPLCKALSDGGLPSLASMLFLLLRPILLVLVAGILPGGYRILPVIIFFRGCLMAYAASACFVSGISPAFVIVRGFVLLPLFYFFCRWVYRMQTSGSAPLWVNPQ